MEAKLKEVEDARKAEFATSNKAAVFALVEARKIDPADAEKYEALRQSNVAAFDAVSAKMPVLAHLATPKELLELTELNQVALLNASPKAKSLMADDAAIRAIVNF